MSEAVVVSTAHWPIGSAFKGALKDTSECGPRTLMPGELVRRREGAARKHQPGDRKDSPPASGIPEVKPVG